MRGCLPILFQWHHYDLHDIMRIEGCELEPRAALLWAINAEGPPAFFLWLFLTPITSMAYVAAASTAAVSVNSLKLVNFPSATVETWANSLANGLPVRLFLPA